MAEKLLEVKDLTVLFGKHKAVNNMNIVFKKGETVLIAGRNGAGKSTFLRVLGQLIIPDRGFVDFMGLKKKGIGIITDKMSLFDDLSLRQGIEFHKNIFGIADFDHSVLDHLGIGLERKISSLSSGERAIFHLSLLMSQKPELLLIDEVFYLVDPYIRDIFIEHLIGLIDEEKASVVMVNQTFTETGRIPERVIIMDEGGVLVDEERETLLSKVRKLSSEVPEPVDLPVFFSRNTPFGSEYYVFPFDETKIPGKSFFVEKIGLDDIIKAFLGGRYAEKRV